MEGAPTPLFLREDWEQVVGSMPAFNGDGPVPAEAPEDPVDVSSGDSSEEKRRKEGSGKRGLTPRQSQGLPPFGCALRLCKCI